MSITIFAGVRIIPVVGSAARVIAATIVVLDVNGDVPDLSQVRGSCSGSYNDCVSSIRVFKNQ